MTGETGFGRESSPAAQRNRQPILAVLRDVLPEAAEILEIASGTGEHAAWFAAAMPGWRWQPSDRTDERFGSIGAWAREVPGGNLAPPIVLDTTGPWPPLALDAVFCANMIHIAPWEATLGLLRGAAQVLRPSGRLLLYGPFHKNGAATAPSNAEFDRSLKSRNPAWGVRDLAEVAREAAAHGFTLEREFTMPANNLTVVFRRN
jgi:SAM-dependent methyltransferase